MNFIQPQIDRDSAWQRLHRRRFEWVRRAVGTMQPTSQFISPAATGSASQHAMPMMELVWLPQYRVTIAAAQQTDLEKNRPQIEILVDAYERRATPCLLTDIQWVAKPDQEQFKPDVTESEATELAHRALLDAGLLRTPWARGVTDWETLKVQIIHYPYWVYYFRRRQRIGVKLLDAVTGKPTGPGGGISLLSALASIDKSPKD